MIGFEYEQMKKRLLEDAEFADGVSKKLNIDELEFQIDQIKKNIGLS